MSCFFMFKDSIAKDNKVRITLLFNAIDKLNSRTILPGPSFSFIPKLKFSLTYIKQI